MKKNIFLLILCAFFSFSLFAQVNQEVFYSFSHVFDRGMESNQNYLSASYNFQSEKTEVFAGFQTGSLLNDGTLALSYIPFVFISDDGNTKKLGYDLIYHIQFHDSFCEQDFLFGSDFQWITKRKFFIKAALALKYKYTNLYSIEKSLSKVEPDLFFSFGKTFACGTSLSLTHAFHSDFRYNSISQAVYTFCVRQDLDKGLVLKAEAEASFTDQMAAVNHLESFLLRFFMGVRF